ncbi:unnamed protein product [Rodentolepis nana]|uniref:F-box/LRR-repeat protein 15-like leucin rich repeat domain-containing protein n=1 Tax=Rodentolepis nana TaxID=102285 RepID=A0A3P7S4Q4_RODNA|nr:unnamed protein product [Rodentolepis nana]
MRLIGCSRLNDAAIDLVCEHMRFLQVLELSTNPLVTNSALATIGGSLNQLEYLSLDRCASITNEGLRSLNGLLNLQVLTLRWCSLLTDEGLLDILKLKRLRFLSLAGCKGFTTNGLQTLTAMKNLHKLEITNISNSRECKKYLSKIMPNCCILN